MPSVSSSTDPADHPYLIVYKQERFLMMVTAPLLVLAAYFLREPVAGAGLRWHLCSW